MPYTSLHAAWRLYMVVVLGWLPRLVCATHIVGGHLEMKAIPDRIGHFSISLTYFFDELQTWPAASDALIVIYRKHDNAFMDSLRIQNQTVTNRPPVIFANETCAKQAKMEMSLVRYEGEVQLNPSTYSDLLGYYLAYQTCCRNGGVINIQEPSRAGYVYYLEFPPLLKNGQQFINSSPTFGTLNGDYICINQPFTYSFKATDTDGDQLRYSLTTPLYGFQDASGNPYIRPAPYPEVQWLTGYDSNNAIPGNPPLSINPQTGELNVTANKLGLYVFAVRVEEYRNGEKIGEIRRDFQFLVIDCPSNLPPDATISILNQPAGATEATICEGSSTELQATDNPNWHYQWKYNGSNILGANTNTQKVSQSGTYSLETSLKDECSQSKQSTEVTIKLLQATLTADNTNICPNDSLLLHASAGINYTWFLNEVQIPQATNSTFYAHLAGIYSVNVTDSTGCSANSSTINLSLATLPTISLPKELITGYGGQVDLQPIVSNPPIRAQWQPTTYLTNPNELITQAVGIENDITYILQIETSDGCQTDTSVQVIVRKNVWIPDAFSPNGDGINEVWELKGIDAYPEAELNIYNRWGQLVFHTKNGYKYPFTGTLNGENLPEGSYNFTLRLNPNRHEYIKGSVFVIR